MLDLARRAGVDIDLLGKLNIGSREAFWTKLWIYDLRTNLHFTLKENPIKRADLDDFVTCYNPKNRHERKSTWSE